MVPNCSACVGHVATQWGMSPGSTPLPMQQSHLSMPSSVYCGTPNGQAKKQ